MAGNRHQYGSFLDTYDFENFNSKEFNQLLEKQIAKTIKVNQEETLEANKNIDTLCEEFKQIQQKNNNLFFQFQKKLEQLEKQTAKNASPNVFVSPKV